MFIVSEVSLLLAPFRILSCVFYIHAYLHKQHKCPCMICILHCTFISPAITFLLSKFLSSFSLFMFINGERPGVLGIFSHLTSESTCMFSVTTLPNTQVILCVNQLYTSGYTSRDPTHATLLPPPPFLWQATFNFSIQEKGQLSFKTLIIFFFLALSPHPRTRRSTESSSSWTS